MRSLRWCVIFGLVITAAGAADARRLRVPGTECSVFGHGPCPPVVCSVFDRHPCIVQPEYWGSQDLRLTIESKPAREYTKPDHDLDTIRDLFAALRACWQPPAADDAREGMQMSVRLSFKRTGEAIAPPRVTYTTPEAPSQTRQVYRDAITAALARCAPLPLTAGLGGAIAGRPIAIRYVDNRELEQPKRDKPEQP